jgi:hypothetical protein
LLFLIEGNKNISKAIDFPSLKKEMPEKIASLFSNISENGLPKGIIFNLPKIGNLSPKKLIKA